MSADRTKDALRAEQVALRAEMDNSIRICNFYSERGRVKMPYFLLDYDNDNDRAAVRRFDERAEAYEALKEGTIGKPLEDELVLFITDSEATLRRTHPRYFYTEIEMAEQAAERILSRYNALPALSD